jgi:replicative DNA helicase
MMTGIRHVYSNDSESSILGALMLPNCSLQMKQECFDLLSGEMFYLEMNKDVFNIQKDLFKKGMPIDMSTVTDELEKIFPNENGLFAFVGEKVKNTPSAANLSGYIKNVRDSFFKRQLISICSTAQDEIYSGQDAVNVLSGIESELNNLSKANCSDEIEHLNDISDAWLDEMVKRSKAGGAITGLETGFKYLDQALLGFNEDDLIVLAGKPGTGKTLFSQAICRHAAIKLKKPVLFISMEMSRVQVYERFVSGEARVSPTVYRSGYMPEHEHKLTVSATKRIKQSNLHIVSRPALSLGQIKSICRRFKQQYGESGLIVVDYLTKMKMPQADRRDLAIGEVTAGLKELAQEIKYPVLLLSQMNRGGDRFQKRPQMTDLKDSSSIEQDADVIIFLHREGRLNEYYPQDMIEVIIRKSRHVDAESTIYLYMTDGGYIDVSESEAIMEIERMQKEENKQNASNQSKGGFTTKKDRKE